MSSSTRPTLQACLDGKHNNLDFMRFVAASGVILSHSFAAGEGLKGTPEPLEVLSHKQFTIGTVCVAVFFIISGLLVTRSWERTPRPRQFLWARALRIFPGLAVSLLLITFVMGSVFTTRPLAEYLTTPETYTYLLRNLALRDPQWNLPGVFETNAYPGAINGALWSLQYEVGFYLLVVGLGLTGFLRREWAVVGWLLAVVLNVVRVGRLGFWPELYLYFGGALALYLWRDRVRMNPWVALGCAVTLVATAFLGVGCHIAMGSCGAYLVLYLGFLPGRLAGFGRHGDFSYGLYVYGFPVQQTVTALMGGFLPWWLNAVLSYPGALLLAVASWKWVEQPALRLKGTSPGLPRQVTPGRAT
ncbi:MULTISPECIES: acyltransferase [unclassified Myxococcus]|uniref:acyltransferase family protein n=1 Tax=unclassified Myxococcus TaxID=2648731 RepID=UPI00157AB59A|nr:MULTISPECIES: acyltransferase [unclassified Myxococcus]NTX06094.1 acyltransferase [Myxococcus sp. CA040A]NTX55889.1 acyltransferase [Myxococcus sp. CA039A]